MEIKEVTEVTEVEKKILEAAKIVFVRKGYENTAMKDIADEAGISRTALNYYFRTKENLFSAIFGEVIRLFVPRLETIADDPAPFLQKIDSIVTQYMNMIWENPLLPYFIVGEVNRDADHLLRVVAGMKEKDDVIFRLMAQITDEMDRGLLRKMPLIHVFSTFFALMAFPMLTRNVLTNIFLEKNKQRFNTYYFERKTLVVEQMTALLTPKSGNDGITIRNNK